MRIKNHIKTPEIDSLRGIGKLGWGESGKMSSTLRRLESSFEDEVVAPPPINRKVSISCPKCGKKFKVNNPSRIPQHTPDQRRSSYYFLNKTEICSGSYSKQKSENFTTSELSCFNSHGLLFTLGEKVIIDFSRTMLNEINHEFTDMLETKVQKIEYRKFFCHDGTVFGTDTEIYFENVPNPIPLSKINNFICRAYKE